MEQVRTGHTDINRPRERWPPYCHLLSRAGDLEWAIQGMFWNVGGACWVATMIEGGKWHLERHSAIYSETLPCAPHNCHMPPGRVPGHVPWSWNSADKDLSLQPSCIYFTIRKWFLPVVNIHISRNKPLCKSSKTTLCLVWDITKSCSAFQKP